jgi:hypothetical protein
MAAPTLEKTWQISPNNKVTKNSEHTFARYLMWLFKDVVTSFASNPWTVHSSSDGVSNFGAADYWTAWTNLLWGTGNHSWIVFNLPSGVQVKFDQKYTNANCEDNWVCFSPGALYTGGSLSAAPTATDEVTQFIARVDNSITEPWWSGFLEATYAPKYDCRMHVWHSTDGLVTRMILMRNGLCPCFWRFEDLSDPRTGHTNPFCAGLLVASTSPDSTDVLNPQYLQDVGSLFTTIAGSKRRLYNFGLMQGTGYLWTEGAAATGAEAADDEINVSEVAYFSYDTGARGPKGHAADLWFSPYQYLQKGMTSPAVATTRDFVHVQGLCLPWTGDATPFMKGG